MDSMNEFTWRKSRYQLLLSQWGIVILVEAGYKISDNIKDADKYIKISENVYFYLSLLPYPDSQSLVEEEVNCFCEGLALISNRISEILQNRSCLITLRSVLFSDCDVQKEGFTACAVQWASEAFGFPLPTINVSFDSKKSPCGKYVFDFSHI